jgi:hypothetical protein
MIAWIEMLEQSPCHLKDNSDVILANLHDLIASYVTTNNVDPILTSYANGGFEWSKLRDKVSNAPVTCQIAGTHAVSGFMSTTGIPTTDLGAAIMRGALFPDDLQCI